MSLLIRLTNKLIKSLIYFITAYLHIFLVIVVIFLIRYGYLNYGVNLSADYQTVGTKELNFTIIEKPQFVENIYNKDNHSNNKLIFFQVKCQEESKHIFWQLRGYIKPREKKLWQQKLTLGQKLKADVVLKRSRASPSQIASNLQKGFFLAATIKKIKWLGKTRSIYFYILESLEKSIENFAQTLHRHINQATSSIIIGMTFGRSEFLPTNILKLFRILGLSHLLVASAANLSLIFFLFQNKKVKRRKNVVGILIFLCTLFVYICLTRVEPNIVRSSIFILLKQFFIYYGYYQHPTAYNSLATLFSILINPLFVFRIGFLMGVILMYGLLFLFTPPFSGYVIEDRIESKYQKKVFSKTLLNIKKCTITNLKTYWICQIFLYPFFYYFASEYSFFGLLFALFITPLLTLVPYFGVFMYMLSIHKYLEPLINLPLEIVDFCLNKLLLLMNNDLIQSSLTYQYGNFLYIFIVACIILYLYWSGGVLLFKKYFYSFKPRIMRERG